MSPWQMEDERLHPLDPEAALRRDPAWLEALSDEEFHSAVRGVRSMQAAQRACARALRARHFDALAPGAETLAWQVVHAARDYGWDAALDALVRSRRLW